MKHLILLLFAMAVMAGLSAQNPTAPNPELQALVQKALEHYPRLRELETAAQTAGLRTDIQRAGYLPTVSANASFRYLDPIAEASFGPPGNEVKIKFQPHDNYDLGLNGSGLIFDFGRTKSLIDKAVADAAVSRQNLESMRTTIAYQVAQLYYGIIFSNKSLAVQTEQLQSLQANIDLISNKLKNGDALELDLMNAQVAFANSQNRQTDLSAQLEKQMALLSLLTGEVNPAIKGDQFDFQQVDAGAATADKNPDLLLANAKISVANLEIISNKKFLRPSLTYNAGLGFRNGYQPDIDPLRFNWAVGVGIAYPLYVGGRDRKQIKISELSLLAAQANAQGVTENIQSDLAQAQADLKAGKQKHNTAATVVGQARSARALADTRFKNGVATNVDVLTAQSNLEQAQLTELQAQYQICIAGLNISKLQGIRFW